MMMRDQINTLISQITEWDGVSMSPHRFGGTEFNLGRVEIGHVHHVGMVDIPYTRRLREALVAAGEAEPHHILPESGWISFYLRRPGDLEQALRLFRLSYLQKRYRRPSDRQDPVFAAEVKALGFGAGVSDALRSVHEAAE